MSSTDIEHHRETVRRLTTEAWTGENLAIVDELVADNYVRYAPFGKTRGVDGYKQAVQTLTTPFPDIEVTTKDMLAEGNRVAFRFLVTGTHDGPFGDVEPTGKAVRFTGVDIHRFAHGELFEEWFSMDLLGLLEQLGVVSMPDIPDWD